METTRRSFVSDEGNDDCNSFSLTPLIFNRGAYDRPVKRSRRKHNLDLGCAKRTVTYPPRNYLPTRTNLPLLLLAAYHLSSWRLLPPHTTV